jgi:Fe-S oxidoreductase
LFIYRIFKLSRYLFLGYKEERFDKLLSRGLSTAITTLGQWCQLKGVNLKDKSGIGHVILAWGFSIFVVFYVVFIIVGAGFGLSESLEQSDFFFYYSWIMDIIAPIVILAALWAIFRRYVIKPPRLEGEQTVEAMVILITVLLHPVTHLLKIATAIALNHPPAGLGAILPPISSVLSNLFNNVNPDSIQAAHTSFFWAHWLVILFVLVFVTYSRYLHMVASLFNIFFRSPLPKGVLRSIDLESEEVFGCARITDLTWKQLLDLYSCVVCGQCQDACPATTSGKPLNPKTLIQDLKQHLLLVAPSLLKNKESDLDKLLSGEVVAYDKIWACTTCRACDELCPLYVEHIDKIIDMRRNLVMEQAIIPETAEQALRCMETRGHPWRGISATRNDWFEGIDLKTAAVASDFDLLFWVGCTGALEERSIRTSRSIVELLKQTGVNFAILGTEESCCGEPARRLGNEYLFQIQVEKNIKTLNKYGVKKIITACPHCFNTIKNEYHGFGGDFDVIHHTQFINTVLKKISFNEMVAKRIITYHDPCYLGRYNDIYKPPREILSKIPGVELVEMAERKKRSFCCGGGGGRMWLEENIGKRISEIRVEQTVATNAKTITTACPFCLQMFDDAIKAKGLETSLKAIDIAELVLETVKKDTLLSLGCPSKTELPSV